MENQLALGGQIQYEVINSNQVHSEFDIKSISSSGRFNLYDSWNMMKCGALVLFRNQIPFQVNLRGSISDDVEWELVDLGFDGAKIEKYGSYVCFGQEIDKQLQRIGLHSSCGFGHSVSFDYSDEGSNIFLYDHHYKIEVSPIRAIRALMSIKGMLQHADFWAFITNFQPKDWIALFMGYDRDGEVFAEDGCIFDIDDCRYILRAYNSLSPFSRTCFDKWCEGDYLAMLEISKRILDEKTTTGIL